MNSLSVSSNSRPGLSKSNIVDLFKKTAFFFPMLFCFTSHAFADNARDWQAIPIDTPLFFTYYLNTEAKTKDSRISMDTGLLRFSYAFALGNGNIGSLQILQPFSHVDASFHGNAPGAIRNGNGDTDIGLAINVFGGPALTPAQFAKWKPETFLTAAFWVTAPTGRYDKDTVLNTGEHRWRFKPLIAFGHPFGKNWIEVNAWARFFTDNDRYAGGGHTFREDPGLGLEFHLSRNVTRSFWLSADVFYTREGKTEIDGFRAGHGGDVWQAGIGGQWMFAQKDGVSFSYTDTVSKPAGDPDSRTFMVNYFHMFY